MEKLRERACRLLKQIHERAKGSTARIIDAPQAGRETAKPMTSFSGVIHIGKSVCVKGEITGDEDLTIDGKVEGKVELKNHNLVIGSTGQIRAEIAATSVQIVGSVIGNVTATELVEIREVGSLEGNILAPRVNILDGAHFMGSVDMSKPVVPAEGPSSEEDSKRFFSAPVDPPENS